MDFAGAINLESGLGASQWVSFWAKWPGDSIDPQNDVLEPSDETLVRTVQNINMSFGLTDISPGVVSPVNACCGLIAFDGGHYPDFYERGIFGEAGSLTAPPNPVLDAEDDWIIRVPFLFNNTGSFQVPVSTQWIESRAMRKLPPGTGILAVFACVSVIAAPNTQTHYYQWNWDARMAIKSGYTR